MKNTVYTGCNLIDVENGCTVVENVDIYVADGKIEKIAPHGETEEGYRKEDMTGLYAAPGLVNAHVHLFGTGRPSKALSGGSAQRLLLKLISTRIGKAVLARLVESSAYNELLSGVTALRAVGDLKYSDVELKKRIEKGKSKARGLKILVSGPAITAPGGHGDGTFADSSATTEGLKALVDERVAHGADLIKVCVTGGVTDSKKKGEPGELRMSFDEVEAVCARAHERGLKVAAHAESAPGAELSARAGVDTVEHGGKLSEEAFGMLEARGGAVVATYSPAIPCAKLSAEITRLSEMAAYNSEVAAENMTAACLQAFAGGVEVGMGTDASCPFSTQYGMWREIEWFALMTGVSAARAFETATAGNARVLGIYDETGSLTAGKRADIIFTFGNPAANTETLREIKAVVAGGRLVKNP
ncbi:MAG: amidohydrolase family protein, partial [Firmicutes bacterium]|nr:amidohydrolase family protein [Candidatus Stercoripulliclostridium pullicola]